MMYLHKISETVKTTTKIESLLDMRDTCTCKKKYKLVRFNTFTSYLVQYQGLIQHLDFYFDFSDLKWGPAHEKFLGIEEDGRQIHHN